MSPPGTLDVSLLSGSPLVEISRGGSKTPLFCIHAAAGHLRLYENLARHLDPGRPVYGLRAVAHAPGSGIRGMAARYVAEIRERQPAGPYIIVGECDGGALAYEVAQQLRAVRPEVLLVLVDSFGPGWPRLRRFVPRSLYRTVDVARLSGFHLLALAKLDWRARSAYTTARVGRVLRRLGGRISRDLPAESPETAGPQAFRGALRDYVALPYDGRGLLFHGAKLPWGIQAGSGLGWGNLVSRLDVCGLPAYFGTNLLEPNVGRLAEAIERTLESG